MSSFDRNPSIESLKKYTDPRYAQYAEAKKFMGDTPKYTGNDPQDENDDEVEVEGEVIQSRDPGDETEYDPMYPSGMTFAQEVDEFATWESRQGLARANQGVLRKFSTGATRNDDTDQLDYEGFLSPLALKAFAEYMHEHRYQSDGELRASDNWQKGIPLDAYAASEWRHHMDFWLHHRGHGELAREDMKKALCGLLFNAFGYLHEIMKAETDA